MWLRFQSQTRPSPATTATGHASPASALSATSVPASDVDDPLLNLRSRSHATNGIESKVDIFICLKNIKFYIF